jgi:TetR/AcrR family transcriptional regulator, transcriptional repressor for nem operon
MADPSTSERLLDAAQRLVQQQGFHGFSYNDLSHRVGISKASIHYHFPGKQDLILALLQRYRQQLAAGFAQVEASGQAPAVLLRLYLVFFGGLVREDKLCLCAALANDRDALAQAVQTELQAAFDDKTQWLAGVLRAGAAAGSMRLSNDASSQARAIVASVEGAMLLARAYKNSTIYDQITDQVWQGLCGDSSFNYLVK